MSTELVRSSGDLVQELLDSGRAAIDKRLVEKEQEHIERLIVDHYERVARQTMEQIWDECSRRTGHTKDWITDESGNGSSSDNHYRAYRCRTCHHPSGWQEETRRRRGIEEIARRLRTADQAAGTEWIPDAGEGEKRGRIASIFR